MGTIRVIIAKPGLDGHDRGAKVVARALRDAGVEVIYTGLHQTPEQIVAAAIQEDADAIGLSILSGAHMTQFARVLELLADRGASDIVVFGGGIVPEQDITELQRMGVARIFTPGASTHEIVAWVHANLGGQPHPSPRAADRLPAARQARMGSAGRARPACSADRIPAATGPASARICCGVRCSTRIPCALIRALRRTVRSQSSGERCHSRESTDSCRASA